MEQQPKLDPDYHYTVKELAFIWNVSAEFIRRLFAAEPGVMIFAIQRPGRRIYRTIRIPGSVALRVRNRMLVVVPTPSLAR